jgi:Asp-tRNA(Asn)/Glu-tRNA(Gln) amidotransferase A subunit family amidase
MSACTPAISLLCGMDDGRPSGLMLVPHYDEETIYRAVESIERSGDWISF